MNKYEGAHRECQAELERMDCIKNVRKRMKSTSMKNLKYMFKTTPFTNTHTKDYLANRIVGYRRKGNAGRSGCQAEKAKLTLYLSGLTC